MKSYSPLRYPGGKSQVYQQIVKTLEKNNLLGCTYIEPFAGGSGIAIRLLFENKVKKVIINDFDKSIYAVWYSILFYTDEFVELINNTAITIEEWYKQKKIQKLKETESILTLGFSTFFLNRTNRSGIIKGGVIGGKNQNGNYKMDCRFNKQSLIELIYKIASFKNRIEISNLDAIDLINSIKRQKNQFYFIDPPYFHNGRELYTNFFTDEDHTILSKYIKKNMKTKKYIISYDNCVEIQTLYRKFERTLVNLNYSLQNKKKASEIFITNNIEF